MALEKGTEEFMMMGDYFYLVKKYWNVQSDDRYWNELKKSVNEFVEKYKMFSFSKKLAMAFLEEQELKSQK